MKPIKNRFLFYLLSFTWGLPLTLFGCIAALFLTIIGKRPKKHGYCYYFEIKKGWGGLEMGIFFLANESPTSSLLNHELGHAMQNCYFGFFMPFIICIPSAMRYWVRRKKGLKKRGNDRKEYDSVWFEGTATRLGNEFMEWFDNK